MARQNVISGLLLFFASILLGPYMVVSVEPSLQAPEAALNGATQELSSALQSYDENGAAAAERSADDLAAVAARALSAQFTYAKADERVDHIKVAHAHGNLEGLLNVLVGLFLMGLAVGNGFKQVISWLFIVGSWLHGGGMVLGSWGLGFMFKLLPIGAPLLVLAVLLLIIAVVIGKPHSAQSETA